MPRFQMHLGFLKTVYIFSEISVFEIYTVSDSTWGKYMCL